MVRVVCRQPKQLVILECTRYPSLDDLAETIAVLIRTGNMTVLKWAEGVVFSYTDIPPSTESLTEDFFEGKVYWSDVMYASMPEYKPIIRVGTMDIPVINVTPNSFLRQVAKWLKQHKHQG
jgi:hypothetical protein